MEETLNNPQNHPPVTSSFSSCPKATSLPQESLPSVRLSLRQLVARHDLGLAGTNDDRAQISDQLGTGLNQMELPNPYEEWEDSPDPNPGHARTLGDAYIPYRPPGQVNTQAPSHSVLYSRTEYAELYDTVDRLTRHSKDHTSTKTDSLEDVGLTKGSKGELTSTVLESDISFQPKPNLWETLEDPV